MTRSSAKRRERAPARAGLVVGIDPGLSGAVAVLGLSLGKPVFRAVHSMPFVLKPSGRKEVDAQELFRLLREYVDEAPEAVDGVRVLLEKVNAMPGQGVSSMFSLGDSFGVARAAACAVLLSAKSTIHSGSEKLTSLVTVAPTVWKRELGLLRLPKSFSLREARRLYPAARPLLFRQKDEGRAEALLIAHYARTRLKW